MADLEDLQGVIEANAGTITRAEDMDTGLDPANESLVKAWTEKIQAAKKFWERKFDNMRDDMMFARGKQWGTNSKDDRYRANIVQRHIQQRTSALYARNPKFIARRRDTMDFAMWDESATSLQGAYAQAQMGDMMAAQMLQDAMEGMQHRQLVTKVGKTLEIVFKHQLSEQIPPFKTQAKQLVRRAITCSVGYVKLGYQRAMQIRPEDAEKITDVREQIATLERIAADLGDDKLEDTDQEVARLRHILADLEQKPMIVEREGLVFDFPSSTSIIIDPVCRLLKGFIGASWVAQEYLLTPDQVKEIYGIDLKGASYTMYRQNGEKRGIKGLGSSEDKDAMVCVWEIYSKSDRLMYVVADGYCEFLQPPAEPPVKLERFWPFFDLAFNELEDPDDIYPPSDVELLRPMQEEYNRARQGLREHRHANRPKTAVPKGMLDDEDKTKLQSHPANAVIELNALQPGQKISDVLQAMEGPRISSDLYDTSSFMQDVQFVVGSQEANLGGTSGATATEVSVAEGTRFSSIQSNVDDLDDFLSDLARSAGQVLLHEMNAETVQKIAGRGAVWPELSMQDIADELVLEIEAGSAGRPNRAAEIQNFERLAPLLMQLPGISPEWLVKQAVMRLDDRIDLTEAVAAGAQSIIAQNAMAQQQQLADLSGSPANAPGAQGMEGMNRMPRPAVSEGTANMEGLPPGVAAVDSANFG